MWVFGYGSLIWKVEFPYVQKCVGFVKGYARRFWQGSEDHRGIPGMPGRVVTLVESDNLEERVYGVAYEIGSEHEEKVVKYLDHREKGGYTKKCVTFFSTESPNSFIIDIYIATMDNPLFLGDASFENICIQILNAHGPSGSNVDYLFKLADGMRQIAPHVDDHHLFELERLIKHFLHQKL